MFKSGDKLINIGKDTWGGTKPGDVLTFLSYRHNIENKGDTYISFKEHVNSDLQENAYYAENWVLATNLHVFKDLIIAWNNGSKIQILNDYNIWVDYTPLR